MPPNGPFYRHDTTEDTEVGERMPRVHGDHLVRTCCTELRDVPRYSTGSTALASIRSTTRPSAAATSADSTTSVSDAAAAETTTVSAPVNAWTTLLATT